MLSRAIAIAPLWLHEYQSCHRHASASPLILKDTLASSPKIGLRPGVGLERNLAADAHIGEGPDSTQLCCSHRQPWRSGFGASGDAGRREPGEEGQRALIARSCGSTLTCKSERRPAETISTSAHLIGPPNFSQREQFSEERLHLGEV